MQGISVAGQGAPVRGGGGGGSAEKRKRCCGAVVGMPALADGKYASGRGSVVPQGSREGMEGLSCERAHMLLLGRCRFVGSAPAMNMRQAGQRGCYISAGKGLWIRYLAGAHAVSGRDRDARFTPTIVIMRRPGGRCEAGARERDGGFIIWKAHTLHRAGQLPR